MDGYGYAESFARSMPPMMRSTSAPIVPPFELPSYDPGYGDAYQGWPMAPQQPSSGLGSAWQPPIGSSSVSMPPAHQSLDDRERYQRYEFPPSAATLPVPSSRPRPFQLTLPQRSPYGQRPLLSAPTTAPLSHSRRSSQSGSASAHSPGGSPASVSRAPSQRGHGRGKAQGSPSGAEDDSDAKEQKRLRNAQARASWLFCGRADRRRQGVVAALPRSDARAQPAARRASRRARADRAGAAARARGGSLCPRVRRARRRVRRDGG